ncbi:MAG: DUF4124 domain-containing protein [Pseudomonadota bacterium]
MKPMRLVTWCLPIAIGLALAHPAVADVYRWTDEAGNVHYGSRPPNENAEPVKIAPRGPVDPNRESRAAKQKRLLRAYEKERRDKRKADRARERAERKVARKCKRLAKRIANAQTAKYIYRKNEQGERTILSHEDRAAYEKRLRSQHKKHCR